MNLKDRLTDEELAELKEAEKRSIEEKKAAKRRAKRAKTKYGLRLEEK